MVNIRCFVASPLPKSGEYSKVFCLSSGLLGPFGPHQARARGSSCRLLRLSGLAQASGTPMRMLAGARTALQTKRASRSQLSQVTGSASAQGVPTAAVKVVGGSGGGGTKKVGIDCFLCRFSVFYSVFFWMTGSAPAQGVPTAAVKVVGGSGGGGTKKIRFRAVFAFVFGIFQLSQIPKKPLALQRRVVF